MNTSIVIDLDRPIRAKCKRRVREFRHVLIDYWDGCVEYTEHGRTEVKRVSSPETMAFPCGPDGRNALYDELCVWYDETPDFERYKAFVLARVTPRNRICEAVQLEDGSWAVKEGFTYNKVENVVYNHMPDRAAAECAAEQRKIIHF